MAKVQCENGHFYNNKQHSRCPTCGISGLQGADMGRTVAAPLTDSARPRRGVSEASSYDRDGVPGATIGLFQRKTGLDPVVGWLVCVKGVNKGRDYRLKSDVNKIGRDVSNDVCIERDETISRESHFQVVYSTRNKRFNVVPDAGRNLVYLNGDDVLSAMLLKAYDKIEVGDHTLVFMPLCSGEFDWSDFEDDDDDSDAKS